MRKVVAAAHPPLTLIWFPGPGLCAPRYSQPATTTMESRLNSHLSLPLTTASLCFLLPIPKYRTEKPYYVSRELPKELQDRKTNLQFGQHPVEARDIRSHQEEFTLDHEGFCVVNYPSSIRFPALGHPVTESDTISDYLKETTKFVRQELVADLCLSYQIIVCLFSKTPGLPFVMQCVFNILQS